LLKRVTFFFLALPPSLCCRVFSVVVLRCGWHFCRVAFYLIARSLCCPAFFPLSLCVNTCAFFLCRLYPPVGPTLRGLTFWIAGARDLPEFAGTPVPYFFCSPTRFLTFRAFGVVFSELAPPSQTLFPPESSLVTRFPFIHLFYSLPLSPSLSGINRCTPHFCFWAQQPFKPISLR